MKHFSNCLHLTYIIEWKNLLEKKIGPDKERHFIVGALLADAFDDLDRHWWQSALVGRCFHRAQVQAAVLVLVTDGAFCWIEKEGTQAFLLYFKKCPQQRSSAADLTVGKVLRHVDDDANEILSRTVLI